MKKTSTPLCLILIVLLMALPLSGCRSVEEEDDIVTLAAIKVTPDISSLGLGESVQLSAAKIYTDAGTSDCSSQATWSSSEAAVATFSQTTRGLLTGIGAGDTTIQATCSGTSRTFTLTVRALSAIAITPADSTLPIGLTRQLTATATYTDGSTAAITSAVSWSSANTGAVIVGNTDDTKGLARGLATGTVIITAALASTTGTTDITISAATLESIEVRPVNPSVPVGTRHNLIATGVFSDKSVLDLTDTVDWSSSETALMSLSRSTGSDAVQAYAKTAGTPTVTARYGGVPGNTQFTVVSMTQQSIEVSPAQPSLTVGGKQALKATGIYWSGVGGSVYAADITDYATWSSSAGTVVSVSNVNAGMVTALLQSSATISASDAGGVTPGNTVVTVGSAELEAIEIYPARLTMTLNSAQRFTAVGIYSDHRVRDLTDQVSWTSSDNEILQVQTTGRGRGKATAVKAGTVYLSVTLAGSTKGASAAITCSDLTLSSLEITPKNPRLFAPIRFKAVGVFSDNSTQDLTDSVLWSSSAPSILKISNDVRHRGEATRIAAGSATVTATFGSKSATTDVTSSSAGITELQLTPVNSDLAAGFQRRMTVTARLDDNTTVDLTDWAVFGVSDAAKIHVRHAEERRGLATALTNTGSPTITAYFGSHSANTNLTLSAATLSRLEISPENGTCIQGKRIQFQATGIFSDATSQDLTDFVVWRSSDILTAGAFNAPEAKGSADCLTTGNATISAAIGSVTGTTGLTVLAAGLSKEARQ